MDKKNGKKRGGGKQIWSLFRDRHTHTSPLYIDHHDHHCHLHYFMLIGLIVFQTQVLTIPYVTNVCSAICHGNMQYATVQNKKTVDLHYNCFHTQSCYNTAIIAQGWTTQRRRPALIEQGPSFPSHQAPGGRF